MSQITKNKTFDSWLPLQFITFFFLLLTCSSTGVEIIVTFPRDVSHPQEMGQEDLQENK